MASASRLFSYVGPIVGTGADLDEHVLLSYTLPANTLTDDGMVLHMIAAGNCAKNTDQKIARIDLNGTPSLIAATMDLANAPFWTIETFITRVGNTGLLRIGREVQQAGGAVGTFKEQADMPVNWSEDTIFTVTGQNLTNPTAGSVQAGSFVVMLWP